MKPKRVQRSRRKGYRLPAGVVYVGRPTKWGNPYPVGVVPATVNGESAMILVTASMALDRYRAWLAEQIAAGELDPAELRGKDLACWCRLDQACHADVLLELSNR
jgi:hypothetical protein